jgi:hypothetical protein
MMIMVELTNFKISEFLVEKSELPERACTAVCKLKLEGVKVKYVQLDNAGENKAFATLANSKDWDLLQRNYLVEVGLATLWGRLRAMFDTAFVPEEEKYKLLREGIQHLTFLDGLMIKEIASKKMTKFGHMYSSYPKLLMPMRIWGEVGTMKVTGKIKSKLKMGGSEGMFVGYARAADTHYMYLLGTNSIHETRTYSGENRCILRLKKATRCMQ